MGEGGGAQDRAVAGVRRESSGRAPEGGLRPGPAAVPTPARQQVKVLILTGDDYPGHLWKLTTPVLRTALEEDPRLVVAVAEQPEVLASTDLGRYDVLVLHWMNWEKPDPGPPAREGLREFVAGGKGLVLIHFACGAFQDWPEFRAIAGRVYDPALPPHDPYGPFRVDIVQPSHPLVSGLPAFETADELYTCLAGEAPVEVLATARSKVTGRDEPMALVHAYGEGRVFQTPLGHDVAAFGGPRVRELLRRGVAWAGRAAPLEPVTNAASPTVAPERGKGSDPLKGQSP